MALIFVGSSRVGSTGNTSRVLGPLVRWFHPGATAETIHRVQVIVRKTGHLTEYAVLAVLLWRARRHTRQGNAESWSTPDAVWAFTIATAYAVTDEIHQSLVPERLGSIWDVGIDAVGALLGLFAVWVWGRRQGRG
jgi:VanZ family protein